MWRGGGEVGRGGGGRDGGGERDGARLSRDMPAPAPGEIVVLFESLQQALALVQLSPLTLQVDQQLLKESAILALHTSTNIHCQHSLAQVSSGGVFPPNPVAID